MKNRIEKFLNDYKLTAKENVIAVGFSGGYDSMALLDILNDLSKIYNFSLVAAHLNHNWRGIESEKELLNCKDFCKKNNITFYTETLDEKEKHTETRARELRYAFYDRVINKYNATALLTAHTKSDTAETLIYRMIKGSGIKGLQGISPKLGKIFRPMLNISRLEVEEYCNLHNLSPNNDSSNKNNNYARNFIRNEILPKFKEINSNTENALDALSKLAYEEELIIKEYIEKLNVYNNGKIITSKFINLSKEIQKRLIYEFYVKYDFEYSQEKIENALKFVIENINSKSGKKCSIDNTHWIFVNTEYIEVIEKQQKLYTELTIDKEGSYTFENLIFSIEKCTTIPNKYPRDDEYKAYVELNEINFTLRTRREGDRIQPLGSDKLTKLKKYFINKNIPQHEKDSIVLLCKGNEILWVSGYGINDKIKVGKNCTHVLTLNKIGGTQC